MLVETGLFFLIRTDDNAVPCFTFYFFRGVSLFMTLGKGYRADKEKRARKGCGRSKAAVRRSQISTWRRLLVNIAHKDTSDGVPCDGIVGGSIYPRVEALFSSRSDANGQLA